MIILKGIFLKKSFKNGSGLRAHTRMHPYVLLFLISTCYYLS
jgi:hypothetical protein